jgi:hypothetical protein
VCAVRCPASARVALRSALCLLAAHSALL